MPFTTAGVSHKLPGSASLPAPAPGCPGLSAHYDDHCVLVLQLAGAKAWLLQPPQQHPAALLPLTYCPRLQLRPLAGPATEKQAKEQETQDGVVRLVLRAGDLLYVPRGWGHQAAALRPGDGDAGEGEAGDTAREVHGRTGSSYLGACVDQGGSGRVDTMAVEAGGPAGTPGEAAVAAVGAGRAAAEARDGATPGPDVAGGCSLHITFGLEVGTGVGMGTGRVGVCMGL